MRNTWIAKAGAAALVIGAAGIASAQSNGPSGLSARIGVFLPTEHSVGGTWFAGGIDYKLNSLSASTPVAGSIGYFGLSADYYNNGGNSNIPVVLNYNLRQGGLVWSLGAGIEFYNIPFDVTGSGTGLDVQGAVAYEFGSLPTPFFVQAKYYLASRNEVRGFGLYAGMRF